MLRIDRVDPRDARARWCINEYFAELEQRFEAGFSPELSLPADDEYLVPPRGAFLMATLRGHPVACGAIIAPRPGVGCVKRMWVAKSSRGIGLGRELLHAIEQEARSLGLARLQLETNRSLHEAIALYRTTGYLEVPAFNDEPYADLWFEKTLLQL